MRLGTAEPRESPSTFALDQRPQRLTHQCTLFGRARQPLGLSDKGFVKNNRRPHLVSVGSSTGLRENAILR